MALKGIRLTLPKDPVLHAEKITILDDWISKDIEWRGTRAKFIVVNPQNHKFFLVKFPMYGSAEIYFELFNCYLGKNLGLKYADYFMARHKGKLCIATKSFLKVGDVVSELWEMKDLICYYASRKTDLSFKYGRSPEVLREHHIDQIYEILLEEFGEKILPDFFRMIGFDCLTGHGDRHWENYGVLIINNTVTNSVEFKFAPIYDTAYGYLLETSDEKSKVMLNDGTLDDDKWYSPRIRGLCKITIENNIKASHVDLFKYILQHENYKKYSKYMVEIVDKFDNRLVKKILDLAPLKVGLSDIRKDVIIKVLDKRSDILKRLVAENKI
ncbi:MAG: HipA domain-containing protein [Bdellovibrionales bacterium]|nr:HipA domain-containing protein [Bdellovibrionales bacterium]